MGRDKKLHFIVGALISLVGGLLISPVIGLVLSIIAGIYKDVVNDLILKRGQFEWLDILYTALGGILIYLFLI